MLVLYLRCMHPNIRAILVFIALAVLAYSEARAFQSPSGGVDDACFVRVDFEWKQFDSQQRQSASWQLLFRTLTGLLNEAYGMGVYDPQRFPVAGSRFEGSYAIYRMGVQCVQARDFVRQLFSAYRQRLTTDELTDAPTVIISEEPSSNYEFTCGLGATALSCPNASSSAPR